MSTLMNTYSRLPVEFTHGEGVWLYDTAGNAWLDALSGIAVCGLGHAHPALTKAISEQAGRLLHTSNIYHIGAQRQLADKLIAASGMDCVFFSNSGAEANEAAIKLARMHGHHKGIDLPTIIVFESSFHGRTLATLSATGNRKVQAGFGPLVKGFARAPFADLDAVKTIAKNNQNIVAVLVEPIQGEGGVHIPEPAFLDGLRELCDQNDWLLMLDEVQTGNGRTGKYFAYQHHNWLPDVVTTAKGLANGVPIGACLASGKATGLFGPGNHGSTFGGNPLACAAGIATIDTIINENYAEKALQMGDYIQQQLREKLAEQSIVKEIRGKGLLLGIELKHECTNLVQKALEKRLLINVTNGNVIRLLPPLIIQQAEADQLVAGVCQLINAFAQDMAESA